MRPTILALAALSLAGAGCSSVSSGAAAPPIAGPAPWQGHLADRMNLASCKPTTPALKSYKDRAPLLYLTRTPERGVSAEPGYELAVFDDGTLVYEGHRCVKIGGVVLRRLAEEELVQLGDLLAALCVDLAGAHEGELCDDAVTLRLTCSAGHRTMTGSDHCRQDEALGRRIEALRAAVVESLDLASWVGEPMNRQACTPGARDLAPHELALTISSLDRSER